MCQRSICRVTRILWMTFHQGCFVGIDARRLAFKLVLPISNPTSIYTLQDFNKIVIHHGSEISSYSSDVLARVALGSSTRQSLDSTYEKVAGNDGTVLFCRIGQVGKRTIRKLGLHVFLLIEWCVVLFSNIRFQDLPASDDICLGSGKSRGSFGHFQQAQRSYFLPLFRRCMFLASVMRIYLICFSLSPYPKTHLMSLHWRRLLEYARRKGLLSQTRQSKSPSAFCATGDLWTGWCVSLSFSSGSFTVVPDFTNASDNQPMYRLKARCESAKPLGLVRCDSSELLLVYDGVSIDSDHSQLV